MINIHEYLMNNFVNRSGSMPYTSPSNAPVGLVQPNIESAFLASIPTIFNGAKHSLSFFKFFDCNNMPLSPEMAVYYDRRKKGYCIRPDVPMICTTLNEIPASASLTCKESQNRVSFTANGTLPILQTSADCTSVFSWQSYDIIVGSEYWASSIVHMPEYNRMDFKDRLYVSIPLFRTPNDDKSIGVYALKKRFEYTTKDQYYYAKSVEDASFSLYNTMARVCKFKTDDKEGKYKDFTEKLEQWAMQSYQQIQHAKVPLKINI